MNALHLELDNFLLGTKSIVMPHDYTVEVCLSNNYKDYMLFLVWPASVSTQYHKWWTSQEKMMPLSNVCECDENGPWTERVLAYQESFQQYCQGRHRPFLRQVTFSQTCGGQSVVSKIPLQSCLLVCLCVQYMHACCLIIPSVQNCYNRLAI